MGEGGYLTPVTTDSSSWEHPNGKKHDYPHKLRHGRLSGNSGHARLSSQINETEFTGPAEHLSGTTSGRGTHSCGAVVFQASELDQSEKQLTDNSDRFFQRREQHPSHASVSHQSSSSFPVQSEGGGSHRPQIHPADTNFSSVLPSGDWAPPASRLAEATEANPLPLPRQRSATHHQQHFGVVISGSSYHPPSEDQHSRTPNQHELGASSRPQVGLTSRLLPSFSSLSSHVSDIPEKSLHCQPVVLRTRENISSSFDSIRFGVLYPSSATAHLTQELATSSSPNFELGSHPHTPASRHHSKRSHRTTEQRLAQSETRNRRLYGAQGALHPQQSGYSYIIQAAKHRVHLPGIHQIVSDPTRKDERVEGIKRVEEVERQFAFHQHPPVDPQEPDSP